VGPVEDPDHAWCRQFALDTPQVRVRTLLLGRGLESFDLYALGIDHANGVANDTALA